MNSTQVNPFAAPRNEIGWQREQTQWQQRTRQPSMRHNCLYFCIVVAVALATAYHAVQSMLFFGPVLAIAGLWLAYNAAKNRDTAIILLGSTAPLLVLLVTLLVMQRFWGPIEMRGRLQLIFCCYAMIVMPVALSLVSQKKYQAPVQPSVKPSEHAWSYE